MKMIPTRPINLLGRNSKVTPGDDPASQPPGPQWSLTTHTSIQTVFTRAGGTSKILDNKQWARVTLLLETAGPVAFGTTGAITPVLSGKGQLLPTGKEVSFVLPPGDKLYLAAEAINRIGFRTEPLPWLEQIYRGVLALFGSKR